MARKLNAQETLLIAAARTLGKAAGTLVNMTQILTTEPTPPQSHSAAKPESIKPESPNKNESPNKKKSSATVRQNQTTKQGHAIPKKRTAKSRKGSPRNTIATKRGSSRKG